MFGKALVTTLSRTNNFRRYELFRKDRNCFGDETLPGHALTFTKGNVFDNRKLSVTFINLDYITNIDYVVQLNHLSLKFVYLVWFQESDFFLYISNIMIISYK